MSADSVPCEATALEPRMGTLKLSGAGPAAVSRAGGLGVLGCVRFNDAEELDKVLDWMDENTDGRPYGVENAARLSKFGTKWPSPPRRYASSRADS